MSNSPTRKKPRVELDSMYTRFIAKELEEEIENKISRSSKLSNSPKNNIKIYNTLIKEVTDLESYRTHEAKYLKTMMIEGNEELIYRLATFYGGNNYHAFEYYKMYIGVMIYSKVQKEYMELLKYNKNLSSYSKVLLSRFMFQSMPPLIKQQLFNAGQYIINYCEIAKDTFQPVINVNNKLLMAYKLVMFWYMGGTGAIDNIHFKEKEKEKLEYAVMQYIIDFSKTRRYAIP
jgi:hypothetical protein